MRQSGRVVGGTCVEELSWLAREVGEAGVRQDMVQAQGGQRPGVS